LKYELDNGKIVNIPDKDLTNLEKSLEISHNEAILTWLSDNDYISDETVEELSEKAKKNRISATIHQAKAENSAKKERKPREKKENPLKRQIIDAISAGLCDNLPENAIIDIKNDEKYIDLCVNGLNFTVNLVQHRPKK
jgi:hypothetical protein